MRNCSIILLTLLLIAIPLAAMAGAPLAGTYKTLFSTILPGKATESMPADLAEGQIGNMIWAESWDGSGLGTNWKVMCPSVASAPVLIFDTVDGAGNGQRAWLTTYGGGTMWLSGAGAWANGDPSYTATLSQFSTTVYKQYINNQLTGAVTNINLKGMFDGYTNCFDMAISNAELVGYTPVGFPPAFGPFPPFHGPGDCSLTGSHGTYWDVHDVTLNLWGSCVVPATRSTWGQIKTLYR